MSNSINKVPYPLTYIFRGLFLLALLPIGFASRLPTEQLKQQPLPILMLLGSTDSANLEDFVETAVASSNQKDVEILILPLGLASNSERISEKERQSLLNRLEEQKQLVQAICSAKSGSSKSCRVNAAPILVRSDALSPEAIEYLAETPTAILVLDDNPMTASNVIANTPFKKAMEKAYGNGTLIAGGKSLLKSTISGFSPGFDLESGLIFGAPEISQDQDKSNSSYKIQNALLETDFFHDNKFSLLFNALTTAEFPKIGFGLDDSSTIQVSANRFLNNPTGFSVVPILDAATYHAAESVQYQRETNSLSLRNMLLHILTPGEYSYDLQSRQHSLASPPERIVRSFEDLIIPASAGPLVLSGELDFSKPDNQVLSHFVDYSGGKNARILILAGGYPTQESAQEAVDQLISQLPVPVEIRYFSGENEPITDLPPETTGIILLARYPSLLPGAKLGPVVDAWRAGMPVLAIDAAASMAGATFISQELPSSEENGSILRPYFFGLTSTEPGLQMVDFNIEPQVNSENRWGRWIHLAYYQPNRLSIGLEKDSALSLSPSGTFTIGRHPIALLDLRYATLGLAPTSALIFANGLVDLFAPGEVVFPRNADANAVPFQIASPEVFTPTPQLTPSPSAVVLSPTPGVLATPTEVGFGIPIPDLPFQPGLILRPPPGRMLTVLLIVLPVLTVIIILLGLWINRRYLT